MANDQNQNEQQKPGVPRDGNATGGEQFRGHYGDETGDGSRFLDERGEGAENRDTPASGMPAGEKPVADDKQR